MQESELCLSVRVEGGLLWDAAAVLFFTADAVMEERERERQSQFSFGEVITLIVPWQQNFARFRFFF